MSLTLSRWVLRLLGRSKIDLGLKDMHWVSGNEEKEKGWVSRLRKYTQIGSS